MNGSFEQRVFVSLQQALASLARIEKALAAMPMPQPPRAGK